MIINLSKPRAEYFKDPTPREIVERVWQPQVGQQKFSVTRDLPRLAEQGKLAIGASSSLDDFLAEKYSYNSRTLVDTIDALRPDQLLILPFHYRFPAEVSRQVVVYNEDTLVKLDAVAVKRQLLKKGNIPKGSLSAKRKREVQWAPETVLRTAFDQLQLEGQIERTYSSYSWFGKDHHRRIVSLYRAIQGAELRAFQNFAAFTLMIPLMRKELREGKSAESGYSAALTAQQQEHRKRKIRRYETYLARKRAEGFSIAHYVKMLDVDFSDLIEPKGKTFGHRGGRMVQVPSRSRPEITYNIKYTSIPFLEEGDPRQYSMAWDLRGHCGCEDKTYRSDRRREDIDRGQDEDFFCAHEIAGLHTLVRVTEAEYTRGESPRRVMPLPLVLPTGEMMRYVERLRQQTLIVEKDLVSGEWTKHVLNSTEIENLLWKRVIAFGYDRNFTTDKTKLLAGGYDPHTDLITFRCSIY